MADTLGRYADRLEKAENFEQALHDLIRSSLTAHRRILFGGNGYEQAWVDEAARRGLSNLPSTADALPTYILPKNVDLMVRNGVLSRE